MSIHDYRPLSNAWDVSPPSEEGSGFWWSVTPHNEETARSFIEIHPSSTGRKICIRISNYIWDTREIRLGECVLLTRNQCLSLIHHLEAQNSEVCSISCSCDPEPHDFLEVFRTDENIVQMRISSLLYGELRLGLSVDLDSRKIVRVIHVLNYLMNQLPE